MWDEDYPMHQDKPENKPEGKPPQEPFMKETEEKETGGGRLVLHRKWRSQDFEEIVGQEHVVRTLKNALAHGRIAPAYLFCGPRGTGKTSMARILAKALNCPHTRQGEPCNKCRVCADISAGSFLDVIEMDAASHTQVDKIREFIVEKVNFRPVEAQRKVYIIDEVHKLSSYSFDALLKTIEEPPPFVVFILATTEVEKLPPTIISRCQRFDFKRIPINFIMNRLRYVCEQEKFCIEDGALNLIAQASDGALRDALVILEQAVSFTEGCVTAGEVVSLLGMTHSEVLFSFGDIILNRDTHRGLIFIDDIYNEGKDLLRLVEDLLEHFRRLLLIQMVRDAESIIQVSDDLYGKLVGQASRFKVNHLLHIIKELMELRKSIKEVGMERLLLEMAVVKLTRWELSPSIDGLSRRISELEARLNASIQSNPGDFARRETTKPSQTESAYTPEPTRAPLSSKIPPVSERSRSDSKPISSQGVSERNAIQMAPTQEQAQLTETGALAGATLNDAAIWHSLLREVKKDKIELLPILQNEGAGRLQGDKYILKLSKINPFNRDFLEKNRKYVESLLEKIARRKIKLILETSDQGGALFESPKKPYAAFVQEVVDMFGATPVDKETQRLK